MKHFLSTSIVLTLIFTLFSCSSDSEDPTPKPDMIAPTVDFTIAGASGTGGSQPVVVSNQIQINIDAKDAEGIAKVEAFIDDQKVGEDTTAPYQITIDVSGYTSKTVQTAKFTDYVLKIVVTDTSGNSSSKEEVINIVNETPLITINFLSQSFNSDTVEFYIFASTLTGEVLDIEKIEPSDASITLSTTISEEDEYMLTFAELNSSGVARFNTISNLTSTLLPDINLNVNPKFELKAGNQIFQASGFDSLSDFTLGAFGILYVGGIDYTNFSTVQVDRFECTNCNTASSNSLYFSLVDSSDSHKYLVTDWDIDESFVFSPELFTNDGIEKKSIQINNTQGFPLDVAHLRLLGYFSQTEFENNFYHLIEDQGSGELVNNTMPYVFNTIFEKYSHEITLDGYYTNRSGIPANSIEPLDWTISYILSENSISIQKNSIGDILGKIILGSQIVDENYIPYSWALIFNSQEAAQINIPELPEEIKSWEFFNAYSTSDLQVRQVEIKKYEGLASFEEYLNKIIAPNKRLFSVSNSIESVFTNTESSFHSTVYDWLID